MSALEQEEPSDFPAFVMRARALGVTDARILSAIERVDRLAYLSREDHDRAFSDQMMPLPCGQAIERLDDAAQLLQAAGIGPHHRVLEIGTGSGYLTAVIASLCAKVVTVERYRTLLVGARERHARQEIGNVSYLQRDGAALPQLDEPFDRVISTVAYKEPPKAFVNQLVAEGTVVTPIGGEDGPQPAFKLAKIGSRFDRTELFHGWFPAIEPAVALAL